MKKAIILLALSLFIFACNSESNEKDFSTILSKIESKAHKINNELEQIRLEADNLANYITNLYLRKNEILPSIDKSKYELAETGVFYKPKDDGGSAVYVSAAERDNKDVKNTVYFTEPVDKELIRITKQYKAAVQVYYNNRESYNRIYPFMDVLAQYEPALQIPDFNFYYLADKKHNPEQKSVWVNEAYVDPAGRGWMISAIAPVYVEGKLEGVPGIDITTNSLTDKFLTEEDKNIVIVDQNGVIVTAKDYSINLLSLPPLKDHRYIETIKMDTYRRDNYNLLKSKEKNVRAMAIEIIKNGKSKVEVVTKYSKYMAFAHRIDELSWTLIAFEEIK